MHALDTLTREAAALAGNAQHLTADEGEVARQMQICNACRYCEGFCAVFPAMTRRLEFGHADVHFLANLCHNCGACLHACQYAPPHEFAINVPQAMARVRVQTYADFAWPHALGALYRHNGVTVALASAASLALFLFLALQAGSNEAQPVVGGNFYAVIPHRVMVLLFGATFGYGVLALAIGVTRFWRGVAEPARPTQPDAGAAAIEATGDVLSLRYLGGGHGRGCNERDDAFTLWRRRFHHATFYGFMLCFASTCAATLYHYAFGLHAPYAFTSVPVVLGTVGGLALCIGAAGLLTLNLRRDPKHGDARQKPMDRGFLVLLLAAGLTGLALLAWRETPAMPALLAVHLGSVMALFLTLPYGKFAHGAYRAAALLKWTREKRRPSSLMLNDD